jgi:hypothetical protein
MSRQDLYPLVPKFFRGNMELIQANMLERGRQTDTGWRGFIDYSFVAQVHYSDAYLFTAYSALPVADTIQGYYDAAGESVPQLGHIMANRKVSQPLGHTETKEATQLIDAEIDRLTPLIGNLGSVCIVDQFVETYRTIELAENIVSRCGVPTVSSIIGRWYRDAAIYDIDKIPMGIQSMYAIGEKAYQLLH